jgi:hypothetical protein
MKHMQKSIVVLGAALLLAVPQMGWTATKAKKSVVQMMKEAGFKHKTAQWTMFSTTTSKDGKTHKSESKMWISGEKYRMQAKDQKSGETMVYIDDTKVKYMYMPDDKKAVKITPKVESMYSGYLDSDMVAQSARQRKTAKKVGSGKVDGKKCGIYTYKNTVTVMGNEVKSDVKEWVWKKENLPLKSIVKTKAYKMNMGYMSMDMPESETTTLIKDVVLDKPIKDSLFKIPAGTKIETIEGAYGAGAKPKSRPAKKGKSKPATPKDGEIPDEVKEMMKGFF